MTTGDPLIEGLRAAGCVFAEDEARAIRRVRGEGDHEDVVAARAAGVPLEHVLGVVRFSGIELAIAPGVFVPRSRAELLATTAAGWELPMHAPVVDLGTGCGAIAAVLATIGGLTHVTGVELDPVAAEVATRNGTRYHFQVRQGSWWDALPAELAGKVGMAVGYLPHVPTAELTHLPRDLRAAEPVRTVDGGPDGLDPLRQVWADAGHWLAPTAPLLILIARSQRPALPSDADVQVLAADENDLVVALRGRPGCG